MAIPKPRNVRTVGHTEAQTTVDWRDRMVSRAVGSVASLTDSQIESAACNGTDTELFYDLRKQNDAKRVCRGCPVIRECLAVAMTNGDAFAVLGGTTPEDRARIRRRVMKMRRQREMGAAA